jgi:hypothetical protein
VKEVYEFTENHQQCKEEKDNAKEEEDGTSEEHLECELRTYHHVFNTIRGLQEFSLYHRSHEPFDNLQG